MRILPHIIFCLILATGCGDPEPTQVSLHMPKSYTIFKAGSVLTIDGLAAESDWEKASYTSLFTDIEGSNEDAPYYDTRVRMLWDDQYLYIHAELEEEHIWGDITERDAVIFYNNDFEVFIKPDPQEPQYVEFEVNALGTLWELILLKPYRIGGPVSNFWDLNDSRIGVAFNGTLNDPTDTDTSWTVEMALPLKPIAELRRGSKVENGTEWRINFSRVQWEHEIINGSYQRKKDPQSGDHLPEYNWVWTTQYAIDMHRPEHWGIVRFSDQPPGSPEMEIQTKWEWEKQLLFMLHRKQLAYRAQNGSFAENIQSLGGPLFQNGSAIYRVHMNRYPGGYLLSIKDPEKGSINLNQDEFLSITP